jgi:hypothetical protein
VSGIANLQSGDETALTSNEKVALKPLLKLQEEELVVVDEEHVFEGFQNSNAQALTRSKNKLKNGSSEAEHQIMLMLCGCLQPLLLLKGYFQNVVISLT